MRRIIVSAMLLTGCAYPEPVIWAHEDANYSTFQVDQKFCLMMAKEFSHDEELPTALGMGTGAAVGAGYGVMLASAAGASSDENTVIAVAVVGLIAGGTMAYHFVHGRNVDFYKRCLTNGTNKSLPHKIKDWQ